MNLLSPSFLNSGMRSTSENGFTAITVEVSRSETSS